MKDPSRLESLGKNTADAVGLGQLLETKLHPAPV